MKITSTTLLFTLFSVAAITYTFNSLKKDTIGIRSALIWILLCTGIGFFSLCPSLLNSIMRLAQMENRMFFILTSAVFILFALLFNMGSKMEKMQRTSARLVQEIAILQHRLEDKIDSNTSKE